MIIRRRKALVALVAAGLLLPLANAAPAGAGGVGAQFRIQLDARPPAGQPWSFLRYFPRTLSVHQGDVIDAGWGGAGAPHTATAIPSGNPTAWRANNQGPGGPQDPSTYPYALQVPDVTVGGDDNQVDLNPAVAAPSDPTCGASGNPCTFDGSSVVSSGFQFSSPGSQPSFFVHVTAPVGSYAFVCLVHPGMQLQLNVVGGGTSIPDPSAIAALVTHQVKHARTFDGPIADSLAQTKIKTAIPHGHFRYTISAGGFWQGVSADEYRDNGLSVHVGDRIRVLGNFEIHTATFPKSSVNSVPLITTQCEVAGPDTPAGSPADCASPTDFQLAFNSTAVLPTANRKLSAPSRFVNSGLLANPGLRTFVVSQPGTYTMVCLVHGPSMSMKVTVT